MKRELQNRWNQEDRFLRSIRLLINFRDFLECTKFYLDQYYQHLNLFNIVEIDEI